MAKKLNLFNGNGTMGSGLAIDVLKSNLADLAESNLRAMDEYIGIRFAAWWHQKPADPPENANQKRLGADEIKRPYLGYIGGGGNSAADCNIEF